MELQKLRDEIDAVDEQIVKLLAQRMTLVKNIGQIKKDNKLQPLDKKRWKQVLETKITIADELGLSKGFITKIYSLIHEYALKLEK
jgi:chorismate mutase